MKSRDDDFLASSYSSEETPSTSEECLSPLATVPGKEYGRGAAPKACLDGGDNHLRESCQIDGFPNASPHSTNRSKPEILCDQGCDRQAEASSMSREGEISLFCSEHQSSDVITTRTAHCQITGCFNAPMYGQRKGPLKFCPQHKRAGMYTNRNGQLLVATRDGSAFKDEDGTEAVNAATSTNNADVQKGIRYNVPGDNTTGFERTGGESNAPSESKSLQTSSEVCLQGFAEATSLGPSRAEEITTSPTVGVMAATPQYRKMCEVTGCRIQPSYGPSGTSRSRFCSSHKKEGMVGLKNRPCIFPGCSTRPHFDLLGCRPIYCVRHKKANMVHLLKEATTWEKVDVTRDLGKTIRTTTEPIHSESKRLLSVTCSKERQLKQKLPKELHSRNGADDASPIPLPPLRQQQKQKKKEAKMGEIDCRRKKTPSIPITSSSSKSPSTFASSSKSAISTQIAVVSAQGMASIETGDPDKWGNASGLSSSLPEKTANSRLAGTLEMRPSYEIQVFKDIKESAQAEATISGSGRRARVPSRKALEASGKLKDEDLQWLTKEKKEEEARRMKFREQRKAATAVGLREGQVIEAVTIGPTVYSESAGTDGNGVGDVAKSEPTKMLWRKLSPAEILEVAGRKSITIVIDKIRPGGRGQVQLRAEKDTVASSSGEKRKETVWTPQGVTRAITSTSNTACSLDAKRRKDSYGDQTAQMEQVIPFSDRKQPRKVSGWGSTGVNAGTIVAGEVGRTEVCQFEDCSKRATFGVNGTVRYCKLHALFGMHRIDVPM